MKDGDSEAEEAGGWKLITEASPIECTTGLKKVCQTLRGSSSLAECAEEIALCV